MQRIDPVPIAVRGIILSVLIMIGMLSFAGRAFAQAGSGQVAVNLKFLPVQVIEMIAMEKTENFSDVPQADFTTDAYTIQKDYLVISSSEGFQLTVESGDSSLSHVGEAETEVVLKIEKEVVSQSDTIPYFSTELAPLIASSTRGKILKFNVTYDNSSSLSAHHSVDELRTIDNFEEFYNSNIIYTITTR